MYHTPHSMVVAVSRYVALHSGVASSTIHHHYNDFRKSLIFQHTNPCYVISTLSTPSTWLKTVRSRSNIFCPCWRTRTSSSRIWVTISVTTMYAYFNRDSYGLFERDLTVLSQVLDREQSCCAVAHANIYGKFRYKTAEDRHQSIHHIVVRVDGYSVHRGRCPIWLYHAAETYSAREWLLRYLDHPFEELLAWSYLRNWNIMKPMDHRNGRRRSYYVCSYSVGTPA